MSNYSLEVDSLFLFCSDDILDTSVVSEHIEKFLKKNRFCLFIEISHFAQRIFLPGWFT